MTTLSLFPMNEPDPEAGDSICPGARNGAVWGAHNGRMRCDDCKADQAAGRLTSIARAARWRRRAEDSDRYLCYGHAHDWRDRDANGGDR